MPRRVSPILLREDEGRFELTDTSGHAVGRMSRGFTIPRGTEFISGRVAAIIVRKREDSGVEYQNQSRCDAWEVVVPELVFAPKLNVLHHH
jgi:ATP-dependent DNA helicase RecQ